MGSVSRALETYLAYKMLDLIATPFSEWRAFELKLIDEKGNKIKEAKSEEEKEQFSKFMNIARNLKKILSKYTSIENKLSAILIGTSLLKEERNIDSEMVESVLVESLRNKYPLVTSSKTLTPGTYAYSNDLFETGNHIVYVSESIESDSDGIFRIQDCQGMYVVGTEEDFTRIK